MIKFVTTLQGNGCIYIPKFLGAHSSAVGRIGNVVNIVLKHCESHRRHRVYLFSSKQMKAIKHLRSGVELEFKYTRGLFRAEVELMPGWKNLFLPQEIEGLFGGCDDIDAEIGCQLKRADSKEL
jgi:hypothetical protein